MLSFNEMLKARTAYESARAYGISPTAAALQASLELAKKRGERVREEFRKARIAGQVKAALAGLEAEPVLKSPARQTGSLLETATPEQRRAAVAALEKKIAENLILGPEPTPGGPADEIAKASAAIKASEKKKTNITDQTGEAADALNEAAADLPAEVQKVIRAALGSDDSAARQARAYLQRHYPTVAALVRQVARIKDVDKLAKMATSDASPLVRNCARRAAGILKGVTP